MNRDSLMRRLYAYLDTLEDCYGPQSDLPKNCLYFFFEEGETTLVDGKPHTRVVRVGKAESRSKSRLYQHYGVSRLSGAPVEYARRSSIFRRHLGSALMGFGKSNLNDIEAWRSRSKTPFLDIELLVSDRLRQNFSFKLLPVPTGVSIGDVERACIGIVTNADDVSPGWLGHYAANKAVRDCGLWNDHHTRPRSFGMREESIANRLLNSLGF